jgi:hypothetical protein
VGRLQLAQPALTLGWSALLLGEQVSPLAMVAAAAVIAATAVGRNARVDAARTAARPTQWPEGRSGDRPETATQAAPG